MKKTITLLAAVALFSVASFGQPGQQRDNNYGNNHGRDMAENNNRERNGYGDNRGTYYFSAREKDMQVSSINYQYNRKIESIRNKFFMSGSKKQRMIYSLEMQRNADISTVFAKFNDRRNSFDRRGNRHDDRDYNKHDDHSRRDDR